MNKTIKKIFIAASPLFLFGCAVLLWGFAIEPNNLVVNNYDLKIRNWSPHLNGFKIVVVSDIHAGSSFITTDKIREVVAQTNAQKPDLIVLLGDYVSLSFYDRQKLKMPVPVIAENLHGLQARYGVYAILGNADEEYGKEEIRLEFEKAGLKVLNDEIASINVDGENLRLLGMQDKMSSAKWSLISAHLKSIVDRSGQSGKIIVLVHNPDYLPVLADGFTTSEDLSLILAGHTHGGQVRLPGFGALVVPSEHGQKYVAGYIRDQEIDMFVTTGIGTSTIPIRVGVPPEIAVLTISGK